MLQPQEHIQLLGQQESGMVGLSSTKCTASGAGV